MCDQSSCNCQSSTDKKSGSSKYRRGDLITVEFVVDEDSSENKPIRARRVVRDIGQSIFLADEIKTHTPKSIQVGDAVRWLRFGSVTIWTVKCIEDGYAWIVTSPDVSSPATANLADLKRV